VYTSSQENTSILRIYL